MVIYWNGDLGLWYSKDKGKMENINATKYWDAKWKENEHMIELDMHERFKELIKFIDKDSSILDIGMGKGDFLIELYTNNITKKLYGVEISGYAIKLAKQRLPIAKFYKTTEKPEELPFKEIDIISCIHTIEHLKNPADYLELWLKSLKKTGKVILIIPLEDKPYYEHLKIYTIDEIENLIQPLCKAYSIFTRQRLINKKTGEILKEAIAVLYFDKKPSINLTINKGITYDKIYVPTDIYIECTNYCNGKCKMCPYKIIKRKKGIMSWELFRKIILDFKKLDIKLMTNFWLHHLGEPLLDPLLVDRIKFIKKELKNVRVVFSSNGALLTKEKSEEILKAGLDEMIISLDSLTPTIYFDMRGLKLENTLRNINSLLEVRDRLNSKIKITLQMVKCKENAHEVEAFREKWKDRNIRVIIKPMHNFLTEGTSVMTKKLLDTQILPCMQPFLYVIIYWNGDLGLCCWDADHYIKDLGNINNQDLLSAFNNEKFREIRKKMLEADCKDLYPCNKCSQIFGLDMNMGIYQNRLRIRRQKN